MSENDAGRDVTGVSTPFQYASGRKAIDLARGDVVAGVGNQDLMGLGVDSDAVCRNVFSYTRKAFTADGKQNQDKKASGLMPIHTYSFDKSAQIY